MLIDLLCRKIMHRAKSFALRVVDKIDEDTAAFKDLSTAWTVSVDLNNN